MQLRTSLLTGLVVVFAGTACVVPASAKPAPKKYCNLISDESGDATGGTYFFIDSPSLDILSGDIATGKNQLVAVLRVKSTNLSGDQWNPYFTYRWSLMTNLNGIEYKFNYEVPSTTISGDKPTHAVTVHGAAVNHQFSIESGAYVWKIDRKLLPSLNKKAGQKFTGFGAQSYASGSKDTAQGYGTTYPDKAPSCVVAK